MIKKLLLVILILILIVGCKKPENDNIRVIFADDELNGGVIINEMGYPCGYDDGICPNHYATHKPVCKIQDPDCE